MRITGGIFRSRVLLAPRGRATRPTSDRVREALFAILGSASASPHGSGAPRGLEGARVLDLYAGTGALGLEALSRGAAHATFVESGRDALGALRRNVAALGVEGQVAIVAADVATFVARVGDRAAAAPFDLVLADPPWALVDEGSAAPELARLAASGAVRDGATVVLERSSRSARPSIDGLRHTDDRRYGDATLAFYKTAILAPPRGDI